MRACSGLHHGLLRAGIHATKVSAAERLHVGRWGFTVWHGLESSYLCEWQPERFE
jgi:hypothetical protein